MDERMTSRPVTTHVVASGEDAITYEVHGDPGGATGDHPALFVFGAPMDASGFGQLAERFPDRVVIAYDPRGAGRNPTGTTALSAADHAEDLRRVIADAGLGPVDAFGTSGGAVTLLALLATAPDLVRRAVVHEPPLATGLPDREVVLDVIADMKKTYEQRGDGPAMAKFIALVTHDGELPDDYLAQPSPDPAMFGMSTVDDGGRTNPLFRNMPGLIDYEPDVARLRALGDRVVVAVGVESGATLAARGARAVAVAIGTVAVDFPSHHSGFLDQPGYPGEPAAFAARLSEVLARP